MSGMPEDDAGRRILLNRQEKARSGGGVQFLRGQWNLEIEKPKKLMNPRKPHFGRAPNASPSNYRPK
jgi:hypothetical protein